MEKNELSPQPPLFLEEAGLYLVEIQKVSPFEFQTVPNLETSSRKPLVVEFLVLRGEFADQHRATYYAGPRRGRILEILDVLDRSPGSCYLNISEEVREYGRKFLNHQWWCREDIDNVLKNVAPDLVL